MLSLREQLLNGIFPTPTGKFNVSTGSVKIPKKSPFLGTITEDGYCDYEVDEQEWYLEKNVQRRTRMDKSSKARNNRKALKQLRGKSIH